LKGHDEMNPLIREVSQGHPGALNVLLQLTEIFSPVAGLHLKYLKNNDIVGVELWCLYKFVCNQSVYELNKVICEDTAKEELQKWREKC
jgi:hypothetical protein